MWDCSSENTMLMNSIVSHNDSKFEPKTFRVLPLTELSSGCFQAFPQVIGSFKTPLQKGPNLHRHMEIFILSYTAP